MLSVIFALATVLHACALGDRVPVPSGTASDSRFALLLSADLAACGPVRAPIPAAGLVPPLLDHIHEGLASAPILLELEPALFRPAYDDRTPASIFHASDPNPLLIDPDGSDTIALDPAHIRQAWRLHDGSLSSADPASLHQTAAQLSILRPGACAQRLSARCQAKNTLRDRCAPFEHADVYLGPSISFVLPLDDGSAIAGTFDGQFMRVAADTRAVEPIPGLAPMTPHLAALPAPNGELWLFGPMGRFARGSFEAGFHALPSSLSTADRSAWLAGAENDIFALSQDGLLEHFDGTRWQTLTAASSIITDGATLAYVGPGEAIAAYGGHSSYLVHVRDGHAAIERLPTLGPEYLPSAVAFVPGFGAVAGTIQGNLFVDGPNGWTPLASTSDAIAVESIVAFEDGFVLGRPQIDNLDGLVTQFIRDLGVCGAIEVAPARIDKLLPTRTGFATLSGGDTQAWLSFVKRKTEAAACPTTL